MTDDYDYRLLRERTLLRITRCSFFWLPLNQWDNVQVNDGVEKGIKYHIQVDSERVFHLRQFPLSTETFRK